MDKTEREGSRSRVINIALRAITKPSYQAGAEDINETDGDGSPSVSCGIYGRQLQLEGKQDEAFEVFRENIKKNPNHWVGHYEAARMASAQGDFDRAVKEMKLALGGAPDSQTSPLQNLIKRLEAREDINK